MNSDWTIESELCEAAEVDNITAAVRKLGLLSAEETFAKVRVEKAWYRAGAETYLLKFVVCGLNSEVHAAIKAFAPTTAASALASQFNAITRRRRLLEAHGVQTPRLYHAGNGVWIEEWIETDIGDAIALAEGDKIRMERIAQGLWQIASTLDDLSFMPISVFPDVRGRGDLPVMIDFGSDLGEPGRADVGHRTRQQLLDWATTQQPKILSELRSIAARTATTYGTG